MESLQYSFQTVPSLRVCEPTAFAVITHTLRTGEQRACQGFMRTTRACIKKQLVLIESTTDEMYLFHELPY